jgi:hypothetical protein
VDIKTLILLACEFIHGDTMNLNHDNMPLLHELFQHAARHGIERSRDFAQTIEEIAAEQH